MRTYRTYRTCQSYRWSRVTCGIALALASLWAGGCDSDGGGGGGGSDAVSGGGGGSRAAGPHAEEAGAVTYWKVTATTKSATGCSDKADLVPELEFSENSYLMYKVQDGLASAIGQSCDTTAASSCSDSGKTWTINGSTLTHSPAPEALSGDADCGFLMAAQWSVTDRGTTGSFDIALSFSGDPDNAACAALDQAIKGQSPNGLGLLDCTISYAITLEFTKAEKP